LLVGNFPSSSVRLGERYLRVRSGQPGRIWLVVLLQGQAKARPVFFTAKVAPVSVALAIR
jgi:hypothetical protein